MKALFVATVSVLTLATLAPVAKAGAPFLNGRPPALASQLGDRPADTFQAPVVSEKKDATVEKVPVPSEHPTDTTSGVRKVLETTTLLLPKVN